MVILIAEQVRIEQEQDLAVSQAKVREIRATLAECKVGKPLSRLRRADSFLGSAQSGCAKSFFTGTGAE